MITKCLHHPDRDAFAWVQFMGTVIGWSSDRNAFCRECFEDYSKYPNIEVWGTNGNNILFRRDQNGDKLILVDGKWERMGEIEIMERYCSFCGRETWACNHGGHCYSEEERREWEKQFGKSTDYFGFPKLS